MQTTIAKMLCHNVVATEQAIVYGSKSFQISRAETVIKNVATQEMLRFLLA